ncbi:MAG TPA: hypothetical protein VFW90_00410 [Candidatus Saccharimonadales bacterium]|nr:hypothetical protein [Candidatus Saccharimonadales bacterium]
MSEQLQLEKNLQAERASAELMWNNQARIHNRGRTIGQKLLRQARFSGRDLMLQEAHAENAVFDARVEARLAAEREHREALSKPAPKEQALLSGNIVTQEHRGGGQMFVTLDNGEEGLYWLYTVYNGSKHLSERAAYLVDKAWQFGLVPSTVMREFTSEHGITRSSSFQEYVPDAEDSRNIEKFEADERYYDEFYKLFVLNYSIWNTDQHKGNVVASDKIYSIDHEHSFWENKDRWRHSFLDVYVLGAPAPKEVVEQAEAFLEDPARQEVLEEQLRSELHYPEEIIQSCLARIRHISAILTTKGRIDSTEELAGYHPEDSPALAATA